RATLPSPPVSQDIYFFIGLPPREIEVSHPWIRRFRPQETGAGSDRAGLIRHAEHEGRAGSPQTEDRIACDQIAVASDWHTSPVGFATGLVCNPVWWVGDEHVRVCPPVGDLQTVTVKQRHIIVLIVRLHLWLFPFEA